MADTITVNAYDSFELRYARDPGNGPKIPRALISGQGAFPALVKRLANDGPTELYIATKYYPLIGWTFAANSLTDIDLSGLSGEFTAYTFAFTVVKHVRLRVQTPTAGLKLTIGNYGLNGWTGWLGSNTATHDVADECSEWNRLDGWPVSATNRILRIANNTATPIVADLLIVGK